MTINKGTFGRLKETAANAIAERNELRDESAKLRELVKAAYRCIRANVSCEECRLVCSGCTLRTAMRELGIEVDE